VLDDQGREEVKACSDEVTNSFVVTEVYVEQDDIRKLASLSFKVPHPLRTCQICCLTPPSREPSAPRPASRFFKKSPPGL
jgi:hypothetical protein